ncbi:error-prone DNA polymerase [Sphingomonas carotinifaciens]|uniref:Error-prone DNA polymerase n=1 Tax=Sphingomonas carotinifaciens TaxID=1166323 RepID=A0A1G7GTN4_9SPHN|nr:error-prone DNA polymerase [Sphingomonas carotinifaciens]MBB4086662.1 error-prone DNA polymerase [Sphingomonas carotinifaciens]MWC43011.1 DNA polymerase III subunit alpha [Sphingomonas carotinifaciens]SDE91520.1 error-prone DNA polymerase, DnaE-like [Sphingomonas carotinifaciens]
MTPDPPRFAELVAATNFSFLDGASHPSDMVMQAVALEHAGIGIADRNTVAGVVRAYDALCQAQRRVKDDGLPPLSFKLAVGARLVFTDGTQDIVIYPANRAGWGRLTRLLSQGNRRAHKGGCILGFDDLRRHLGDLLLIVLPTSSARPVEPMPGAMLPPDRGDPSLAATLSMLASLAPGHVWLGVSMPRAGADRRRLRRHARLAASLGVPLLATGDVRYAQAEDRALHDIVTCIREGRSIQTSGRLLAANGERYLKPASEMARLFADQQEALAESLLLLDRMEFSLDQLRYEYPHEPVPPGWKAQDWLEHVAWQHAIDRYDGYVPDRIVTLLRDEFALIHAREYAHYFLTVYDLVRFARALDPPILCQGRGSAANSAVCFLLGVTSVDPMRHDLLFSRFVSAERDEPPDIDIDFEHERREDVIQHIYTRYGRHRAAIAATVIHYRPKSAVREAGKALGLTEDVTQRLTSTVWGSFADHFEEKRFRETGFSLDNPEIARLRMVVDRLLTFPRHLSQHVGGFVLTQGRLDETVPIHNGAMEGRTFIEWDKDDIDVLGLMKVDILALGMLTCIRKAFDLMERHGLGRPHLDDVAMDEDPRVYQMLQKGDSIGVFQVESRAQINMLPRLKPEKLYDLVVQVAIVRPGPIEGDMVHPYLRRRAKKEAVIFPSPDPRHGPANELHALLGETYGVPLFQEQAMKLAIVAAKFTPDEANQLRKAMATFRHVGGMHDFHRKLVEGMVNRGYPRDFAERCYKQIEGFGSYGFPESHALSFARLVYVSSWIKCFHPAVFACAILNSQPMGFYAPAQLVRDAIQHGVKVHPVDVNASAWDNTLEDFALRLGFRQIDGFREAWAAQIVAHAPYAAIEDLAARAGLPQRALTLLADADAYRSLGRDRRTGLWEARRTPPRQLPLFAAMEAPELAPEPDAKLPPMPLAEQVANDYRATRLSLKGHPMAFLRPLFAAEGVLSCRDAEAMRDGTRARVAGVVLVRQRPGKGNAIFVTIEDETGIVNALMWARDFEANRRAVMAARLMVLHGVIQRSEEGVIHLMTVRVDDRSDELARLSDGQPMTPPIARADGVLRPVYTRSPDPRAAHPRDARLLPKSRDFH